MGDMNLNPDSTTYGGPYARAAQIYRAAGWTSPIPLGFRAAMKSPPPTGYTGWAALVPSGPDVQAWVETHGEHNIGLHLPAGVYVLDVDQYKDKKGADNVAALAARIGPLPPTWTSTARPGMSRHYFFRASPGPGRMWLDHPVPHTESLHTGHRYAVAWPSVNPDAEGAPYRWYLPDGSLAEEGSFPRVEDLAELPQPWIEACTQPGEPIEGTAASNPETQQTLESWPVESDRARWCAPVRAWADREAERLAHARNGGDIREPGRLLALDGLGRSGHLGVPNALAWHRDAYVELRMELRGESHSMASAEWWRQVCGAIGKTREQQVTMCRCASRVVPATRIEAPPGFLMPAVVAAPALAGDTQGFGRSLDDIGNGERLYDVAGTLFRYVGDEKLWRVWDGHRWAVDTHGLVREAGKQAARRLWEEVGAADPGDMPIEDELAQLELIDPKAAVDRRKEWATSSEGKAWIEASTRAAKIGKWAAQSQLRTRLDAALLMFTTIPGVAAGRGDFDNAPSLFNAADRTIETDTATVRPHERLDMLTRMTVVEIGAEGDAPHWHRFLEMNLPDPATRHYFQKLAGYSLTGRANEKLMAYFYGPSDTGKSLAANTLLAVHGEYGFQAPKGTLAPRRFGDDGRDPDRHGMRGARFVLTSESRPGEEMDEALIKSLTGRDRQSTRPNYAKENVSWTPEMLLVVCSNQYPRITGDDDAIWTRIKVIPFMRRFLTGDPERDDRLEERIRDGELPGVLAWMVAGLRAYLDEGLVTPTEVVEATEQFRSTGDGVARWLADSQEDSSVLFAEHLWAERKVLHEAYRRWALELEHRHPLSGPRFYARLEALGYVLKIHRGKRGFEGLAPSPYAPATSIAFPAFGSN
jgi:P4 family phage/plasmid primase-like protien